MFTPYSPYLAEKILPGKKEQQNHHKDRQQEKTLKKEERNIHGRK